MKIQLIEEQTCYIVETDEKEGFTYRRNAPEAWERLFGESWEPLWNCEKMEELFQKEWRSFCRAGRRKA